MASIIMNMNVPKKGIPRGAVMCRDDRPRASSMTQEEYTKRLSEIDWSDHKTSTKIKTPPLARYAND